MRTGGAAQAEKRADARVLSRSKHGMLEQEQDWLCVWGTGLRGTGRRAQRLKGIRDGEEIYIYSKCEGKTLLFVIRTKI